MFNEFTTLSEKLAEGDHLTADLDLLFNIAKETKLIKEIKDIRDELHIISTVLADQERVLVDMDSAIQAIKEGRTDEPAKSDDTSRESQSTVRSYHSLLGRVQRHIDTVKGLDKQAEKTYLSVFNTSPAMYKQPT